MDVEIMPEPSDAERQAILASLDGAGARPPAYGSRWRESGLDDLRGHAAAEDPRRDPGVIEP